MDHHSADRGVVIVGAGQAGNDVAWALRQQGYAGAVTLIGNESYAPYRRPPLSKQFLVEEMPIEALLLRPADSYARQKIDCHWGIGVERIDRKAKAVRLFDATSLPYEHLILATGGRARTLSVPGAAHSNVHTVRTIDDIVRLKSQFLAGRHMVIVGGGFIGLEIAAMGIKKGLTVTVVEAQPRLLARVVPAGLSAFFESAHHRRGVDVRTGVGVHALTADPLVSHLELSDGTQLQADLIVVGIGLVPNTELAEAASLEVANGIVVTRELRTSDPAIYAVGDCSNHDNVFLGRRVRLESVPNAVEHARICAASICRKPFPAPSVPWFWSDQYDLKLQMAGLSLSHDAVAVRGDLTRESFCAIYLEAGRIIAADSVNRPQDFLVAKKLIAQGSRVPVGQLEDETIPLRSHLT